MDKEPRQVVTEEIREEFIEGASVVREEVTEVVTEVAAKVKVALADVPEEFRRIDFYKLGAYFLICAFIGWVWETLAVWATTGQLTDRGFLFIMQPLGHYLPFLQGVPVLSAIPLVWGLPIIMIYGVGGAAICSLFKKWKRHPVELFFIGMVTLTGLELLSSYLCQWMLGRQYWDYTGQFLNFQGRICLSSSLAWGALCVVCTKFFAPRIDRLYMRLKARRNFKIVITVLTVYAGVCAIVKYFLDPTIIPN